MRALRVALIGTALRELVIVGVAGAARPSKRYRPRIRRTVAVQDHVVSSEVRRPAQDAFPERMIPRNPDGRVVRVVSDPRG